MGLIVKSYTFSAGATIIAAEHNTNFDTVYNEINGELNNANIKAAAGIEDTKLDTISTAGKIAITALPSGVGLSNVLFSLSPLVTSINMGTSYITIGNFRWVRMAGVSNVVLHSLTQAVSSGQTTTCFCSIGSRSGTSVNIATSLAWVTSNNIDVTALVTDTVYDGVIMLRNSAASVTGTCQAVTIIGS